MTSPRDLTAEEKTKPYAKYFYADLAVPDEGLLAQLERDHPIDPALALPIERLNDLLEPGYLPCETGWCILPNGAGYVAVNTKMPGVTVDMVNWWYAWHCLEDLRYMLWYPPAHLGISVDEEDRRKVLDPDRSPVERFQGTVHHVLEDVGVGTQMIDIHFLSPVDMGFDMDRFRPPAVATLVGGFGFACREDAPPDALREPAVMCHFVREIEGGVEYRTRFWLGYTIRDAKPELLLAPGTRLPEEAPWGLAQHNVHEYSNLRAFLPHIYAEQGGVVAQMAHESAD